MRRIHIESGPPPRSYDTFEKAVSGAEQHPLQDRARGFGSLLEHSKIDTVHWYTGVCEVTFTNDRLLRVEARDFQLKWEVRTNASPRTSVVYEPVELVWNPELRTVFDPCSQFAGITGAEFAMLFVNEWGLLLYTRGNPILWFQPYRIRESRQDFLFGSFDD